MKVSSCCGASPRVYGDCDCDSMDFGICPSCGEHCDYVEEGVDIEDTDILYDRRVDEKPDELRREMERGID